MTERVSAISEHGQKSKHNCGCHLHILSKHDRIWMISLRGKKNLLIINIINRILGPQHHEACFSVLRHVRNAHTNLTDKSPNRKWGHAKFVRSVQQHDLKLTTKTWVSLQLRRATENRTRSNSSATDWRFAFKFSTSSWCLWLVPIVFFLPSLTSGA